MTTGVVIVPWLLIGSALAGVAAGAAALERIECPATVRLAPTTVAPDQARPARFKGAVADIPLHLSGVSAFDGPPEEGAALKPASTQRAGPTQNVGWRFDGDYPKGKWISCDYGSGIARLAVEVPGESTRCDASVGLTRTRQTSIQIVCAKTK